MVKTEGFKKMKHPSILLVLAEENFNLRNVGVALNFLNCHAFLELRLQKETLFIKHSAG